MKAKFININEKFTEDSDPVEDMGIGIPEYRELISNSKKIQSYINFEYRRP